MPQKTCTTEKLNQPAITGVNLKEKILHFSQDVVKYCQYHIPFHKVTMKLIRHSIKFKELNVRKVQHFKTEAKLINIRLMPL